jgi:lipopolysaccharide/colanic/teichoic acid biosynthesis glycosyltransferase
LSGADWEREYIERIMPEKLRIDLEYLARRNVMSDVGVILQTFAALFRY